MEKFSFYAWQVAVGVNNGIIFLFAVKFRREQCRLCVTPLYSFVMVCPCPVSRRKCGFALATVDNFYTVMVDSVMVLLFVVLGVGEVV